MMSTIQPNSRLGTAVDITFDAWVADIVFRFNPATKQFYFYHKSDPTRILATFKITSGLLPNPNTFMDAILDAYNNNNGKVMIVGSILMEGTDSLKGKVIEFKDDLPDNIGDDPYGTSL